MLVRERADSAKRPSGTQRKVSPLPVPGVSAERGTVGRGLISGPARTEFVVNPSHEENPPGRGLRRAVGFRPDTYQPTLRAYS
jgi:hypothetical protein